MYVQLSPVSTSELLEAVNYCRKELHLRCLLESWICYWTVFCNTWKIGMTSKQNRFHCQDIKKILLNLSSFSKKPLVVFLRLSQYCFTMISWFLKKKKKKKKKKQVIYLGQLSCRSKCLCKFNRN